MKRGTEMKGIRERHILEWVRKGAGCVLTAALLLSASGQARGETAPEHYQRSYELETAGRSRDALKALHEIPPRSRDTYMYELREGWLKYLTGDHRGAVISYRRAIKRAPGAVEPRLGLMLPLMGLRLWQQVEREARAVLKQAPGNYLAESRLAFTCYNLGRYPEAERRYRQLVKLYPGDVDMKTGLAWTLCRQGKTREAAAIFREVLGYSPKNSSARAGLKRTR
jgi:tetratricopeptide (TPR) repeat protein